VDPDDFTTHEETLVDLWNTINDCWTPLSLLYDDGDSHAGHGLVETLERVEDDLEALIADLKSDIEDVEAAEDAAVAAALSEPK
jgi:hypothetical protein